MLPKVEALSRKNVPGKGDEFGAAAGAVLGLALPAIAQLLLQSLMFLADRVMLGHYATDALASMRIASPLHWCIYSTISAFSVGTVALVGRAMGAGNPQLAAAAARGSLGLALVLGAVISGFLQWQLAPLLSLFSFSSGAVVTAGGAYLAIIFSALPLQLLGIVSGAILQVSGDTKTPFVVAIVANSVNIFLNYCLIFGHFGAPALGVRGAAIGSAGAIAIDAIILFLILWRGTPVLSLRGWGSELPALGRILRIATPTFSERLFRSLGYLIFTGIIASLGNVAMASYEVTLGIEGICYEIAEGFGIATAAIVSRHLGAKNPATAAKSASIAVGLAVAALGIGSLIFFLFPEFILSLFSADKNIIAAAVPCLYIAAIAQPFMAASIVLEQALRGAGDTRTAFYISLTGWFIVRIVATYLFAIVWDLDLVGVWLGSTCDWIFRATILLLVFWRGKWQQVSI